MITDVTSQDNGMYTCVARNILGEMTSSASLLVQGELEMDVAMCHMGFCMRVDRILQFFMIIGGISAIGVYDLF